MTGFWPMELWAEVTGVTSRYSSTKASLLPPSPACLDAEAPEEESKGLEDGKPHYERSWFAGQMNKTALNTPQ